MLWRFSFVFALSITSECNFPDDIYSEEVFYPTTTPCDYRYRRYEIIEISCNQLDRLGENVDAIITALQDPEVDFHILLQLEKVRFPNETLDARWYNGNHSIDLLTFSSCYLKYVKRNSFVSPGFNALRELQFRFIINLEIELGNLANLRHLHLDGVRSISKHFFDAVHRSLTYFVIYRFPGETGFNYLFGRLKLPSLTCINIQGDITSNIYRSLHASNFSQLSQIQTIVLARCNIESIHMNTFDLIGKTLQSVDLSGNNLKSVQARWFAAMFDTHSNHYRMLYFFDNPLECSCAFFEWRNMTIYLRDYGNLHGVSVRRTECVSLSAEPLICHHLQTISAEKLYFAGSRNNTYVYPRLDYRLMDYRVVVETKFKYRYRILMRIYKRDELRKYTKCFSPEWLRESVGCLLLENDRMHVLPTAMFENQSALITVFAILTHPDKQVWPLHIRTYRLPEDYDSNYDFYVKLGCVCCLASFFVGITLAYCCRGCEAKRSRQIDFRKPMTKARIRTIDVEYAPYGLYYKIDPQPNYCVVLADDIYDYISVRDESIDALHYV